MDKNEGSGKKVLLTSFLCFVLGIISIYVLGVAFLQGFVGLLAASIEMLQGFLVRYAIAFVISLLSIILGIKTFAKCFRYKKSEIKHKYSSIFLAFIGTLASTYICASILILFVVWIT